MKIMTKTLLAAALTATMGVGSTSAMAVLLNPFEVTEASVPGASPNPALLSPNSAGKITGNYTEVGTFTNIAACGPNTCGDFDISLLWNAGQYVAPNGSTVLGSQLGSFFAPQYQMYAFFMQSGTFVTSGGKTTFTGSSGGNLGLYIDPNSDTKFVDPILGSLAWAASGVTGADDYLIATGTPQSLSGLLDPTLSTCTSGINCGSFGNTTSFALTSGDLSAASGVQNGMTYFTSPVPFYNLAFTSGQFDNFTPSATQTIHGSLDAVFGVPEPESLALLGIGLLGLAMARRGRKQA